MQSKAPPFKEISIVLVTSANDFKREFDISVPFEDKRCMVLLAQ
jgi:hypothetical protein